MELVNEFAVPLPVERAWSVLTDVERLTPCVPGAQLEEIEGDEYRGAVKVKVGPITAQYRGQGRFVERDDEKFRMVLKAEGRETRGQGNASATIIATLEPEGDGKTRVKVVTDLTITGKVAQFGRGVIVDVASKLIGQFTDCLEASLLESEESAASGAPTAGEADGQVPASGPRRVFQPEAEPIDLLGTAGAPVMKRAAPVALVAFVVVLFWRFVRRRRRSV